MAIPRLKITKQRTQHSNNSFTGYELEAAQILLQIKQLIIKSKPITILRWGLKRKRSVIDETQPAFIPVWPPLPLISDKTQIPLETTSPSSPLSLSQSDTDSKSKPSSRTRVLKKKTHKELKDLEDELSAQQQQLKHVREYYEKVRAENLLLKARQLELGLFQSYLNPIQSLDLSKEPTKVRSPVSEEKHNPHLLDLNPIQSLDLSKEPRKLRSPVSEEKHNPHPLDLNPKQSLDLSREPSLVFEENHNPPTIHQSPFINQASFRSEFANNSEPSLQSRVGLRLENCFSPHGIPDLNYSADFQAAMAARARRKRRIEINRVKNCLALRAPRLR